MTVVTSRSAGRSVPSIQENCQDFFVLVLDRSGGSLRCVSHFSCKLDTLSLAIKKPRSQSGFWLWRLNFLKSEMFRLSHFAKELSKSRCKKVSYVFGGQLPQLQKMYDFLLGVGSTSGFFIAKIHVGALCKKLFRWSGTHLTPPNPPVYFFVNIFLDSRIPCTHLPAEGEMYQTTELLNITRTYRRRVIIMKIQGLRLPTASEN